jgi:hypothetical protein
LEVPILPFYWVVGRDGCIVLGNLTNGNEKIVREREDIRFVLVAANTVELEQRLRACRSGEFLVLAGALPPPAGDIPASAWAPLRERLLVCPYTDPGVPRKTRAYTELLQLGAALEAQYPRADNLAAIRNWMLIAARWLDLTAPDAPSHARMLDIARRIVAAAPPPPAALLADFVLLSEQVNTLAPGGKAGGEAVAAFARRHADAGWSADALAIVLCLQCGQDTLREGFQNELFQSYLKSRDGQVRGFLRDFCKFDADFRAKESIAGELTRLDGAKLTLPQDLKGKNVIYQFWSLAHPPKPFKASYIRGQYPVGQDPPDLLAPIPEKQVIVVGINLDTDTRAVAAFLRQHREYADWVQTCSGKGWDDPVARSFGVFTLPRFVVTFHDGRLVCPGGRFYDDVLWPIITLEAPRPLGR